jgi:cyclic pyranopterin phosphate synthase
LNPDRFRQLTRTGELSQVIAGIEAAQRAGFTRSKLNAVILKGINDAEVVDLAEFAMSRKFNISFIEEMPLGHIGSHSRSDTQQESDGIFQQLAERFQLIATEESSGGPSRYFRVEGRDSRIGFISPMSNNFCAACNRVRLTTEGRLLLCLGNEHSIDLREVVRQRPEELSLEITRAMQIKPERHHFDPNKTEIVRFMNATGG